MSVRTAGTAVALCLFLAGSAAAQSPADKADDLNEQGKELYRKGDLAGAADKFRQAIVLSPEARFYYNLCAMLDEMGRLSEALTACEAVAHNDSSEALKGKAQQRMDGIKQRMAARGETEDPGTGEPGTGEPATGEPATGTPSTGNPGTANPVFPPPRADISAPADPHAYRWSFGAAIGVLSNLSLGSKGFFADSGFQFKGHIDFILADASRLGVQGYVHVGSLPPGDSALSTDERLSIVDLGAALFMHRRLTANTYYTPLVGAHVTALEPGTIGESFVTAGLRAEVTLNWLITRSSVLTFTPMLAMYLPANPGGSAYEPADYGLDKAGAALAFTIGYTHRMAQPFGSTPFIMLE